MTFTARQRRALSAICDTFAPGGDGLPAASEVGVPDAFADILAQQPRSDQRRLGLLLSLWDAPAPRRFSTRPHAARETVLRAWRDSRLPARRAAFHALRKAALLTYAMLPGPHRDAWGYPGPLGATGFRPVERLAPLAVDRDTTLECDVCVVGSGAGGGAAAAVLAGAGLDVVVLEAGGYYDEADFDGAERGAYASLYYRGGGAATRDGSIGLLAGACLGGGTTINWTTSFRTPDAVRDEWSRLGVPAFASDEYARSLDAVCARLEINVEHNRPSRRDEILLRGLEALGWHAAAMPRNVRGCEQGTVCGYCGFGCPLGAKRSTVTTWLADASAAGARIAVGAFAERVVVRRGRTRGVEARTAEGHRLSVRARAVVTAGGALETPALLKRSGIGNANVGRHLRLHPTTAVIGVFDEEVRPWEGTLQAVYSDEHSDLDDGYGVKYETGPGHPTLLAAFGPWRSAADHAELMRALPYACGVGVLLRDRGAGEVRVDRDGQAAVRYRLSPYDAKHVRTGVEGAAQILEAAGARRLSSGHARGIAYEPGRGGGREAFLAAIDGAGWAPGRCVFYSFHLMGSARMGASPASSACSPEGELWDTRGLHVCDGSTFPTASGVNPMVSIGAVAHMNALRLAAELT